MDFMLEENIYQLNEKLNIILNVDDQDKKRFRQIIDWAGTQFDLSVKEKYFKQTHVRRGEVWTVNLGENVGSELSKVRPCIVVQNNIGNSKSPTTIVVPISSKQSRQPTHVELNDLDFEYVENSIQGTVIAEQIRIVSKARIGRRIAVLKPEVMDKVENAIKSSLGFIGEA